MSNMHYKYFFFLILLMFSAQSALADMFQPSHSCRKPYKPLSFTSQFEIDMFVNEVERYKECLVEFIEDQDESIKKHQSAAEEAADDWENFKNRELR